MFSSFVLGLGDNKETYTPSLIPLVPGQFSSKLLKLDTNGHFCLRVLGHHEYQAGSAFLFVVSQLQHRTRDFSKLIRPTKICGFLSGILNPGNQILGDVLVCNPPPTSQLLDIINTYFESGI